VRGGKPFDGAQSGLLRIGVEAGIVFTELLHQRLIDQPVLRRHLGGGPARNLATDLSRLDHRNAKATVLEHSSRRDSHDAAADDGYIHAQVTRKAGKCCRARGGAPVATILNIRSHHHLLQGLVPNDRVTPGRQED
jgi:hypothetical protein